MAFTTTLFDVPGFSPQGEASCISPLSHQQAISDLEHPHASILLSRCHQALLEELGSLSPEERTAIDMDLDDFQDEKSLLPPPSEHHSKNNVVIATRLMLIQLLRYNAYVQSNIKSKGSATPYRDILQQNIEVDGGVLGFSAGLFPASVAATSSTLESFLNSSVSFFKLALWIGYRLTLYRHKVLNEAELDRDSNMPFAIVYVGLDFEAMTKAIKTFIESGGHPPVFITSITSNDLVLVVSGRPDVMPAFTASIPSSLFLHAPMSLILDTLYHVPIHAESKGAVEQVLSDIQRRNITFPTFKDIVTPLYSTIDGELVTSLSSSEGHSTLAEAIINMVMVHPTHWNLVMKKLKAKALEIKQANGGFKVMRLIDVGTGGLFSDSTKKELEDPEVLDLTQVVSVDEKLINGSV